MKFSSGVPWYLFWPTGALFWKIFQVSDVKHNSVIVPVLRQISPVVSNEATGYRALVTNKWFLAEAKVPVFHVKVRRVQKNRLDAGVMAPI